MNNPTPPESNPQPAWMMLVDQLCLVFLILSVLAASVEVAFAYYVLRPDRTLTAWTTNDTQPPADASPRLPSGPPSSLIAAAPPTEAATSTRASRGLLDAPLPAAGKSSALTP